MLRRLPMLLVTLLACSSGSEVAPLASSAESARPFAEGQLAELGIPVALARAMPSGLETPVFALTLHDGELVGFQFEVSAERADLQAHGLRRLVARVSPDTPVAVWLSPSDDAARRRVAVMTVNAWPWRVLWAATVPDTVDTELLEALLDGETTSLATLHEVTHDQVIVELDAPEDALAGMLLADPMTDERRAYLEQAISDRRLTLPMP